MVVSPEKRRRKPYHVDELGKFELDADPEDVRRVDHRPDQLVVVGQEIVVETLGVWVAAHGAVDYEGGQQPGLQDLADDTTHRDDSGTAGRRLGVGDGGHTTDCRHRRRRDAPRVRFDAPTPAPRSLAPAPADADGADGEVRTTRDAFFISPD